MIPCLGTNAQGKNNFVGHCMSLVRTDPIRLKEKSI